METSVIQYFRANKLSEEESQACEEISIQCNDFDGLHNPFFIDSPTDEYAIKPFLYYAVLDSHIIGFLSTYVIDAYNIEICSFVLPLYRRRKVATNLFSMLVSDYDSVSIQVSLDTNNSFGQAFTNQMGFVYCSTECSMKLKKEDHTTFEDTLSITPEKDKNGLLVHGFVDNRKIGQVSIIAFNDTVCIHDVEIYEPYRKKGYGYRLIGTLLNHIFEKYDTTILHVTKENEPAYNLYKKSGFEIIQELEYYEI